MTTTPIIPRCMSTQHPDNAHWPFFCKEQQISGEEEVREAHYVYSALDANVIPGPLIVRAGVNPANVEHALASIDEEVAKFAAEGPTEEEVQESRQYLIGSMPRTLETNAGIASYLQMIEYFGLGLDYDLRVPGLLQAVTRDDVVAAARQSLQTARAQVAIAGPYNGSPR